MCDAGDDPDKCAGGYDNDDSHEDNFVGMYLFRHIVDSLADYTPIDQVGVLRPIDKAPMETTSVRSAHG